MRKLIKTIALVCAAAAAALLAQPAAATPCGVSGSAVAASNITYDPFAGVRLNQVTIPLILTRFSNGSAKTQSVNFVLTKPVGTPPYQVSYNGSSILYTEGATQGHPVINSQAAGEINYSFGENTETSTPFNLLVTVPANIDLSAGLPIEFDIYYVCKGTGAGMENVDTPTKLTGAIKINVNVKSGLQATFVGQVLDFGDVSNKTDAEIQAAAATYTTPSTNHLFVKSSGLYEVSMTSANGYKLRYPGSSAGNAAQELNYKVRFLNRTADSTTSFPASVTCQKAGLSGSNLPITATLRSGGVGKVSANYSDTLTVTFSPIVDTSGGEACSTYTAP